MQFVDVSDGMILHFNNFFFYRFQIKWTDNEPNKKNKYHVIITKTSKCTRKQQAAI